MLRSLFLYQILFIMLVIVNTLIFVKLLHKSQKTAYLNKILTEIDKPVEVQNQFHSSTAPFVLGTFTAEANMADGRAANLKAFFRKYNSPLYDKADYIVKISDKYHFDYRLIPAIAMQESTLCKFIPDNSYNCWGYGIYGDTVTRFSSYEEAIDTVGQGIKTNYLDKGLLTASEIMRKYTPSSNGSWARGVNTVLDWLE